MRTLAFLLFDLVEIFFFQLVFSIFYFLFYLFISFEKRMPMKFIADVFGGVDRFLVRFERCQFWTPLNLNRNFSKL